MVQLFNSWREAPATPPDWQPSNPPGAVVKNKISNPEVLLLLRATLPGRWVKVYHHGKGDLDLHYFQHASGQVALIKTKRKTAPM